MRALITALAFSANLLCSGLCGLEARAAQPAGQRVQAVAQSAQSDTGAHTCPHHAPQPEKRNSAPTNSHPHDDGSCPGCNGSLETGTMRWLQASALPLLALCSSQYVRLTPPAFPDAHSAWPSASRERPPGYPLFLIFNVIRI